MSLIGLSILIFYTKLQYLATALTCPLLISLLCIMPDYIIKLKIITVCGRYSLEIFIGNCWTMLLMDSFDENNLIKIVFYFLSNTFFAIILIFINNIFRKNK